MMTAFLIIIGILVVFCLIMAVVSGPFPGDIERMKRSKRKRESKKKSLLVKIMESNPYPDYS